MNERPEAIMMKIPDSFFAECKITYEGFVRYYEINSVRDDWCFYHFISKVPRHEIIDCFLCFGGVVQMKVRIVEFLKNQPIKLPDFDYPFPRDWMVASGPVVKAPHVIPAYKGRGFRYCKMLF